MCSWIRKCLGGLAVGGRPGGRLLAVLLCACMLLQPALSTRTSLAAEGQPQEDTSLCPHHPEHTELCGYEEPTLGTSQTYDESRPAIEGHPCEFQCEICQSVPVYFWQWVNEDAFGDELLVWEEELGVWGLGLPGANEENPLTAELLEPLLPSAATIWLNRGSDLPAGDAAAPESGEAALPGSPAGDAPAWAKEEGITVPLRWDFSALPEGGACEGEYIVTASLPETYVLAEGVPALSVVVAPGGALFATTNKYLNYWRFVLPSGEELLDGKIQAKMEDGSMGEIDKPSQEWTAAIGNLSERTAEEVWQNLINNTLPKTIRGWMGTWGGDTTEAVDAGLELEPSITYDRYQAQKDGFVFFSSANSSWGTVEVVWDKDKFLSVAPSSFSEGERITLYATVPEREAGGKTYQIYVNSNHPEDYKAPDGGGRDPNQDTATNPDLLCLTITLRNLPLGDHIVPAVEPANTTVTLFDYWVTTEEPTTPDGDILKDKHEHNNAAENPQPYAGEESWNHGINQGHLLIFGDGIIHAGLWNKGAGAGSTYGQNHAGMEGIVRPLLSGGYPLVNSDAAAETLTDYTEVSEYKLAAECTKGKPDDPPPSYGPMNPDGLGRKLTQSLMEKWNREESLEYLFAPSDGDYKRAYSDVKGLFQLDDEGYYTYSMRQNFAEFREAENRFILYDAPGTYRTDAQGNPSYGNFFPFNRGDEVFNSLKDGMLTTTVNNANNGMNHHFGMTVEIEFGQPLGGTLNAGSQAGGGKKVPMTFEFSGDDDVWIFIDDVLVLDLGGTHSELYGVIDFSTGEVHIGRGFDTGGIPDDPKDSSAFYKTVTIREMFRQAGREDAVAWNGSGNTFASNTSHTLKMFYLERGNYDSSLAMRFNLQPLLYQQIKKVDQDGKPLSGVSFELFEAEKTEDATDIPCFYTDSDETGSDVFYVKKTGLAPLLTLTTDSDGFAQFVQDDHSYFNFADRGDRYYILRETTAPPGYRRQPEDLVLHYDTSTSMLTIANRWNTGAYAVTVSTVTSIGKLHYGEFDMADEMIKPDPTRPVPQKSQEDGLVVAVPMIRRQTDGTWQALFGSNLGGFQASPIAQGASGEERKTALLRAVLEQAQASSAPDWFLFWDDEDRRLHGRLEDLPGLASRYQGDGGDMRMVCAIIESPLLAGKATAEERYQAIGDYARENGVEKTVGEILDAGGFELLDINQFGQEFRSLIYIPNEQRELWVQKVDQDGNSVNGAEFGLYSDPGCTNLVSSGKTATVNGQKGLLIFKPRPEMNGDKAADGYAKMEWANSSNTAYYLQEISAPAGYGINRTVIPVVVGIYSIYADAGTPTDGVTVMAGVGRLTQTMRQYASENDVELTLQDITAFGQLQPSGGFGLYNWQDMQLSGTSVKRLMNLHFGKNAVVDYGLHDADGGRFFKPYLVSDTGFVRVRVEQNYAALVGDTYGEGTNPNANKVDLKNSDLTSLFSLLNVVVVTDRDNTLPPSGQLIVSKRLAGSGLDSSDYLKNFDFTITLKDALGRDLPGEYAFYGTDKAGYVRSGETIPLHHDESITILGLPMGTRYTVRETQQADWYVSPESGELGGEIREGVTSEAAFVNGRNPLPRLGALRIRKTVSGTGGDLNREFTFLLSLADSAGNPLTESYPYTGSKSGSMQSGETITLRHGESITLQNLPTGTVYTVSEQEANQGGYTTTVTGETGSIQTAQTAEAAFVNRRGRSPSDPDASDDGDSDSSPYLKTSMQEIPRTGDGAALSLYIALAVASLVGIAACLGLKKRGR